MRLTPCLAGIWVSFMVPLVTGGHNKVNQSMPWLLHQKKCCEDSRLFKELLEVLRVSERVKESQWVKYFKQDVDESCPLISGL